MRSRIIALALSALPALALPSATPSGAQAAIAVTVNAGDAAVISDPLPAGHFLSGTVSVNLTQVQLRTTRVSGDYIRATYLVCFDFLGNDKFYPYVLQRTTGTGVMTKTCPFAEFSVAGAGYLDDVDNL